MPVILIMIIIGGLLLSLRDQLWHRLYTPYFNLMSKILGISAYYHDSSACILDNGEIKFASQEEIYKNKT